MSRVAKKLKKAISSRVLLQFHVYAAVVSVHSSTL